jgi:hypothetical protein
MENAALTLTLIAGLGSFGVEATSFVALLGALGLALGLALQGTLGHVASGIMLVIFRPFRIGDFIEADGVAGTVDSITLFTTDINTLDKAMGVSRGIVDAEAHILQDPAPLQIAQSIFWSACGPRAEIYSMLVSPSTKP